MHEWGELAREHLDRDRPPGRRPAGRHFGDSAAPGLVTARRGQVKYFLNTSRGEEDAAWSGRSAVLIVAGDKSGQWSRWYRTAILQAEQLHADYLAEREKETGPLGTCSAGGTRALRPSPARTADRSGGLPTQRRIGLLGERPLPPLPQAVGQRRRPRWSWFSGASGGGQADRWIRWTTTGCAACADRCDSPCQPCTCGFSCVAATEWWLSLSSPSDDQNVQPGDALEVPHVGCSDAPSGGDGGGSDEPVVRSHVHP